MRTVVAFAIQELQASAKARSRKSCNKTHLGTRVIARINSCTVECTLETFSSIVTSWKPT
eukprot:3031748-Amphidinium_carterae.1